MEDGGLADVVSSKGAYLGTAFYNSRSLIRCRLLSRNANDRFDDAFWQRRVQYAWDYRKTVMQPEDLLCCRVIFGEADGFPGLTVDRFGSVLVAQVMSLGMERIQARLLPILVQVLRADGQDIAGVYLRNDAALREKEGLAQGKGWFPLPDEPEPALTGADIVENGIRYRVDFINGQKTGFFLDQKYNRKAMHHICKDKDVLDCFTHMGTFALNAGIAGAKSVEGLDISDFAIEQARENAKRAGVDHLIHFQQRAVADLHHPKKYGFIITNPPYGERLEEKADLPELYTQIGKAYEGLDSWSMYMITSYEDTERYIGRKADKNRKIYNGMIRTYFYQFLGPKPPKRTQKENN